MKVSITVQKRDIERLVPVVKACREKLDMQQAKLNPITLACNRDNLARLLLYLMQRRQVSINKKPTGKVVLKVDLNYLETLNWLFTGNVWPLIEIITLQEFLNKASKKVIETTTDIS